MNNTEKKLNFISDKLVILVALFGAIYLLFYAVGIKAGAIENPNPIYCQYSTYTTLTLDNNKTYSCRIGDGEFQIFGCALHSNGINMTLIKDLENYDFEVGIGVNECNRPTNYYGKYNQTKYMMQIAKEQELNNWRLETHKNWSLKNE